MQLNLVQANNTKYEKKKPSAKGSHVQIEMTKIRIKRGTNNNVEIFDFKFLYALTCNACILYAIQFPTEAKKKIVDFKILRGI